MDQLLKDTFARAEELAPIESPGLRSAILTGARKRRAQRRWAFAGGLLALVALLAVPLARLAPPSPRPVAAPPPGPPVELLLVGVDSDDGGGSPARVGADVLVLVHAEPASGAAYAVAIPRDLELDLPGLGRQRAEGVYLVGGYPLAVAAVQNLTGLRVDAGAVVDTAAVQTVTEAAGGVELCAPDCRRLTPPEAAEHLRTAVRAGDGRALREYLFAVLRVVDDPVRLNRLLMALDLRLGARSADDLLRALRGVDRSALRAVTLPADPAELFAAMRTGDVGGWAAAHPQYVA